MLDDAPAKVLHRPGIGLDRAVRVGTWGPREGMQLLGKRLGVIGLGGIGAEVARIGKGIGMEVVAWNRTPRPGAGVPLVDLDTLLASSDVISLNLTLGEETRGFLDAARIARLQSLNARFAAADDIERRIDLDDTFHLALIGDCGNAMQLDLIRMLMARTRRYEAAYLSEAWTIEQSAEEHTRIIAALEARDLDAAVAALRANLSSGLQPMLAWLKKRKIKE